MTVVLYECTDDPRTLHKSFSTVFTTTDARAYDSVDILSPVIILAWNKNKPITHVNYMAIPDFGRVYRITGITTQPGERVVVSGVVDVLATYEKEISNLSVNVDRYQSQVEAFIPDNMVGFTNSAQTTVYTSQNDLIDAETVNVGTMVLGVIGRSSPAPASS